MASAFQADAFQNGAFQVDAAVAGTAVSRGGIWPHDEKVERAREKAWRAARKAAEELRRILEQAFEDKPAQATAPVAPEILGGIELAERKLAAAEDFGPLAADVRLLRRELLQLIAAERVSRQAMVEAARQAEEIWIALLDEEAAIVTLLM